MIPENATPSELAALVMAGEIELSDDELTAVLADALAATDGQCRRHQSE